MAHWKYVWKFLEKFIVSLFTLTLSYHHFEFLTQFHTTVIVLPQDIANVERHPFLHLHCPTRSIYTKIDS